MYMKRLIIDVRDPREFAMGHAPDAINIPPMELMQGSPQLANVSKDTQLVLYCLSGARSQSAGMYLAQQGFTDIVNGINKDHVAANYC